MTEGFSTKTVPFPTSYNLKAVDAQRRNISMHFNQLAEQKYFSEFRRKTIDQE